MHEELFLRTATEEILAQVPEAVDEEEVMEETPAQDLKVEEERARNQDKTIGNKTIAELRKPTSGRTTITKRIKTARTKNASNATK